MSKKISKKQKFYRMKGCSKTRKKYLGGNSNYPLVYTGKGGCTSCGLTNNNNNIPINTNASNPIYPNTGPISNNIPIFNNITGGGEGCPTCAPGFMVGGDKHRNDCKCSTCKNYKSMTGGNINGLVGSSWSPNTDSWPGVNGVVGSGNHYEMNPYNADPQTSILNMKAGKKGKKSKKIRANKRQKGGALSNFITQDLINLGRQFQFGLGSTYNALAGYNSPVNPMPWRDQIPSKTNLNLMRI